MAMAYLGTKDFFYFRLEDEDVVNYEEQYYNKLL